MIIPAAIIGIVTFGFFDEMFFKLGLYDRDKYNKEIGESISQNSIDDPFAAEKDLINTSLNKS